MTFPTKPGSITKQYNQKDHTQTEKKRKEKRIPPARVGRNHKQRHKMIGITINQPLNFTSRFPFSPSPSFTTTFLTSMIRLPPSSLTLASSVPAEWRAATSSPPPIDFPLIKTLGTVRRPVDFWRAACKPGPRGWRSSSTT